VTRVNTPELDTLMSRPSTSFPNIDRECSPSDLVRPDFFRRIAFPAPYQPGLRHVAALPAKEAKQPLTSSRLQEIEAGDIFHDSLIESGRKSQRNAWAAVGSLAVQLLFLATLVVAPLYFTDSLPKREVLTMLYVPPASGAASNVTRLRVPTSTNASTSTRIPNPVPKTQEAPPPPADTTSVAVGGVPGGVVGGVPGGVLSEVLGNTGSVPVLAKAPEPTPNKRMRVASRVAAANLIHDVAPIYPPEAGRARVEGTVVLLALIGKDGTVQDVRVKSGSPLLAQAAIDAVKQWRYRPYLLNGEPVEVDSQVTITFNLSRG
jgi:periplasmic protein TonB